MLTVKALSDLILQTLIASYPEKAAALMPRESIIVGVAEKILDECVVIPKENYKNYEQWIEWMANADKRWEQLVEFSKSIDDRWAIVATALNMMDVPRREIKHGKTGKRQRIKIDIVDEDEDENVPLGDTPTPPLWEEIVHEDGSVMHADKAEMFIREEQKKNQNEQ